MDILYKIIETVLPFDFLSHNFMKNALLAIILVTPIFGIVGTMIVNNKMAFFSDSIGHSALTGIAFGILFGLKNPIVAMIIFALILAVVISLIKIKSNTSTDTIIGVFSSISIALGIVLLSRGGGFSKYTTYLIGDLLSIKPLELGFLFIVFILVILLWIIFFNKLFMVSINNQLAASKGINVVLYEIGFSIVIALIVICSIQWVGILIINSLLILPAAAARNISKNTRQYHFFSVLIALFSGLAGLILSYYWGTATSATIVLVAAGFYFITLLYKSIFA
jgi:zinc transport system permease protein